MAARFIWGCSSVGRAPALQAGGQEFESLHLHLSDISDNIILYLENRILKKMIKYLFYKKMIRDIRGKQTTALFVGKTNVFPQVM